MCAGYAEPSLRLITNGIVPGSDDGWDRVDLDDPFLVNLRGWLGEHGHYVETLLDLRNRGDLAAVEALLSSQQVRMVRASWELWQLVADDGCVERASKVPAVARCVAALWA